MPTRITGVFGAFLGNIGAFFGGVSETRKTAQAGEEAPTWAVSRKGETRVEGPDARDDAQPKRRTRRTGDEVSQSSASS